MTAAEDELRGRAERARAVALFRYQLVREAADPGLSTRQRGRLVRALANREHPGPFGTPVRVSRQSLDRWITAWRRGGFDALLPAPRQVTARTPVEVLDMAAALKRENPQRTAAQVVRILAHPSGLGALGVHGAAPVRPAGTYRPSRGAGLGVRPVRSGPPQRTLDRRRSARAGGGGPQNLPVRLH